MAFQQMSTALDEAKFFSVTTDTEQSNAASTNVLKYPHTRAVLVAIAASVKSSNGDIVDTDQDGDDGQRISPPLVSRVVTLLQEEKEDELKEYLRQTFTIPNTVDDSQLDQHVLELMHKHRDDVSGVPFLFLTPTRRPTSRPSSRASTNSFRLVPNRPDTPNSLPTSPLSSTFRRPHTPLASPLAAATTSNSYTNSGSLSQPQPQQLPSASSSPLSSPRLLNAKAVEFRPTPRPLSAGGTSASSLAGPAVRTDTPSPDLWAHNPSRATSNLAIAAPLVPDAYTSVPRAITPSSSLHRSSSIDEDYEDEFDPFSTKHRIATPSFHPSVPSDPELQWSTSSNSNSSQSTSLETSSSAITRDEDRSISYPYGPSYLTGDARHDKDSLMQPEGSQTAEEHAELLTDGMTPFDVLSSVFGQSVSPAELTEALELNGYEFESAMGWLVDKVLPQPTPSLPSITAPRPHPHLQMGGRVVVVPRETAFGMRGRGAGPQGGRNSPRYGTRPTQGAHRVCRYFLAGECMRADCRFSHDIERAMCRFWLRGNCAKQENCEFLHHLPGDVDVSTLTATMGRMDLQTMSRVDSRDASPTSTPAPDDFPTLGTQDAADFGRGRSGAFQESLSFHDPGRTRFAAAVKTQVNSQTSRFGRRPETLRGQPRSGQFSGAPVPRPSPRLNLRPPTLLPKLTTGESVNKLYMSYRQRALQLGAARNACLSRAADAWRRGDGAAAKRFSREGHDLNAKMGGEAADAAGKLVRERVRMAAEAVRQREAGWSDEPRDRADRGKVVAEGLGVILGVASEDTGNENGGLRTTPDERTEVLLDLHGLHANEALDVIEKFLVSFEGGGLFGLAFVVVGEEKHTGTQDPGRGTSRARLGTSVREWLHDWGYPWSERDGIICVDPLTHL